MSEPIFHLLGNSLTAKRGMGGIQANPWGSTPAVVNTNQAGFSAESIDMSGGSAAVRPLIYPAGSNAPQTGNISVLLSLYFDDATSNQGLFKMGFGGRTTLFGWGMSLISSGQIRCYRYKKDGSSEALFSPTTIVSTGSWIDIFWTMTGAITTGGNNFYIDGVSKVSQNVTGTMDSIPDNINMIKTIIGYLSDSYDDSRYHLREAAVWDYIVDPTSVLLESGTGSLTGASRTSPVFSTALDGTALTLPAKGDVLLDSGLYGYGSSPITPTLEIPIVTEVKEGVQYGEDGTEFTGTYDPVDAGRRAFINAALVSIGEPSITDDEYNLLTIESYGYDQDTYDAIAAVLTERETISKATDRLTNYFISKGFTPTGADLGKSNIYQGGVLE